MMSERRSAAVQTALWRHSGPRWSGIKQRDSIGRGASVPLLKLETELHFFMFCFSFLKLFYHGVSTLSSDNQDWSSFPPTFDRGKDNDHDDGVALVLWGHNHQLRPPAQRAPSLSHWTSWHCSPPLRWVPSLPQNCQVMLFRDSVH